jgi:bacterioferritin-associated ferredoxin
MRLGQPYAVMPAEPVMLEHDGGMATEADEFVVNMEELREVTAFAEACARELPNATQVKHILGAAAHAARAVELAAGDDRAIGDEHVTQAVRHATPAVLDVLKRYPAAPAGGGRTGELTRMLDAVLRC